MGNIVVQKANICDASHLLFVMHHICCLWCVTKMSLYRQNLNLKIKIFSCLQLHTWTFPYIQIQKIFMSAIAHMRASDSPNFKLKNLLLPFSVDKEKHTAQSSSNSSKSSNEESRAHQQLGKLTRIVPPTNTMPHSLSHPPLLKGIHCNPHYDDHTVVIILPVWVLSVQKGAGVFVLVEGRWTFGKKKFVQRFFLHVCNCTHENHH